MRSPFLSLLGSALAGLALLCCGGAEPSKPPPSVPGTRTGLPPPPAAEGRIRITFVDGTREPRAAVPVYAVFTGRDASGQFCRLDRDGQFRPCSPADNVVLRDGRRWCDYAFPVAEVPSLEIDAGLRVDSGRLYLSAGGPVWLRVDEATGGLVQPDPANPSDPNRDLRYDWIELALDAAGFHGNTTAVDQFGLPLTLAVADRADPEHPLGPVGIAKSRAALFAAWRATLPRPFQALADPRDTRILAPAHGVFGAGGPQRDYLKPYIDALWRTYRREALVLTPDQGTFTGRVDARDRLVFTRDGDPAEYVIEGRPTTQEAFRCDGVLARGTVLEKVLGAQIAAMLNRHVLETPLAWRRADGYYRRDPCNRYAAFLHRHSLGGKAYGFAYDDVNDQSPSLATPTPEAIIVGYRLD